MDSFPPCLKNPGKIWQGYLLENLSYSNCRKTSCVHFLWLIVEKRKDNLEQIS